MIMILVEYLRGHLRVYIKNDLLFVLSTSGKSQNIINVLKSAKKNKIKSIGLLGNNGGLAKKYCDYKIVIKVECCKNSRGNIFLVIIYSIK